MKLALIFPGIGYTCDKPLLYFSQKILSKEYDIIRIDYGILSSKKLELDAFFELAFQKCLSQFQNFDFSKYDQILCISKSVGTAVSTRLDATLVLHAKHILYTPIELTFGYAKSGLAFTGTKDPWVDYMLVKKECERLHIPLITFENRNHSLEVNNVIQDLETLQEVMKYTLKFLESL